LLCCRSFHVSSTHPSAAPTGRVRILCKFFWRARARAGRVCCEVPGPPPAPPRQLDLGAWPFPAVPPPIARNWASNIRLRTPDERTMMGTMMGRRAWRKPSV
jgi:hypothetical protein